MYRKPVIQVPNGRLYDKEEREYISRADLMNIAKSGVEIKIENRSGKDITGKVLGRLFIMEAADMELPKAFIFEAIEKSGGNLKSYIKKKLLGENVIKNLVVVIALTSLISLNGCSSAEFKETLRESFSFNSLAKGFVAGLACGYTAKELSPNEESEKANFLIFGNACFAAGAGLNGYSEHLKNKEKKEKLERGNHNYEDYYESAIPLSPSRVREGN